MPTSATQRVDDMQRGWRRPSWRRLLAVLLALPPIAAKGQSLDEARDLFRAGHHDEAAEMAGERPRGEGWYALKIRAEMARGKYGEALRTLEDALGSVPGSLVVRMAGADVLRFNGLEQEADRLLDEIERIVVAVPQYYTSAEDRVALGRFLLLRGIDARQVLDKFLDPVVRQRPDFVEAHLARAELALGKEDFALAADLLREAPEEAAKDPRFHFLRAAALSDSDRKASEEAIDQALAIDPGHADSLLLRADHQIDAEAYEEAAGVIGRVVEVNAAEPRAWAYRAILAHLRNDPAAEEKARETALAHWPSNPEVDHLLGRKLSQKYRFAEGEAAQRRALEMDPEYLPALRQLGQDLLRLGKEEEGWRVAAEVFEKDGYNVEAYNLVNLRDYLVGFKTLEADGLVVRMDPREAELYGDRVLALLKEARSVLTGRYETALEGDVTIEVFPRKSDFAIRTFGLPGADGFLGVCFGPVITAISPAAQGEDPENWEAVLWHEFCHAVTLAKTRNKMPRWLSEGISVYEEGRRDPAWATPMDPRFRQMILGPELTPLSRLSSAFLAPKTPVHLQFAYFESALAVEFLVEKAGAEGLNGLLDDLGNGKTINEALPGRAGMALEELDEQFAAFARARAEAVAPTATWEEPDLPPEATSDDWAAWLEEHPSSFRGLLGLAARLVAEKKWEAARVPLAKLEALYPEYVGADNAYMLQATVARNLNDPAAERAALEKLAARDAGAGPALARLTELGAESGDWPAVARDSRRYLAVNPLAPEPYRKLAEAAEKTGDREDAIRASRALALLDESDPAGLHFRLARLLRDAGRADEARREVLKALEEAPRYREAHRLLLELVDGTEEGESP
jgi:tetratricopeptide (TPR) repeat protein